MTEPDLLLIVLFVVVLPLTLLLDVHLGAP